MGVRGPANPLAGTLGANTVVSDVTITNNTVTPGNTVNNFGAAIVVEADNQSLSDAKAPTVRANITGNTVPNVASRPVNGEFFNAHIIYFEYSSAGAHGIGQLVDTAPASANATAQLTSTNTGTSQGSSGIALIPGPINTPPLLAASGGVQASSPTPGETHLSQAQLNSVVAGGDRAMGACGRAAGAIGDAGGDDLHRGRSRRQRGRRAQRRAISSSTPMRPAMAGSSIRRHTDNAEFAHAANAAGTDLYTDPTNAAAGHLDLLTAVTHEMGHELGLRDLPRRRMRTT